MKLFITSRLLIQKELAFEPKNYFNRSFRALP